MAFFVKGKLFDGKVEQTTPPVETKKPEVRTKPIVRQLVQKEIVEEPSRYHNIKEGDLHKLINKKSDYLNDMLDLKNNK
jgi:hypothetical protein